MLYHSKITGRLLTEDDLWKLYQPVKKTRQYKQFKEILGYRPLPDSGEERDAIMEEMDRKAILHLLHGVLKTLNMVKIERDALQSVVAELDPLVAGEAARKAGRRK